MNVNYIGPVGMDARHPATRGCDFSGFPDSCYLVEVSDTAGVKGPIIEGDVLVVDEQRYPHHDDFIIVSIGHHSRLHRTVRMGDRMLAIPMLGPRNTFPVTQEIFRGVVICQHRRFFYV